MELTECAFVLLFNCSIVSLFDCSIVTNCHETDITSSIKEAYWESRLPENVTSATLECQFLVHSLEPTETKHVRFCMSRFLSYKFLSEL